MNTDGSSQTKINLMRILEDIFMVLTPKEKEVIICRFSLNNEPRQTLERIGERFSVTRERVRQIEKIALNKLRRTVENTKLVEISRIARELLDQHDGICVEERLVSDILTNLTSIADTDNHIVKLALTISTDFVRSERNGLLRKYWRLKHINEEELLMVSSLMHQYLSKKKDTVDQQELAHEIQTQLQEKGKTISTGRILALMEIDMRFKRTGNGVGLMTWRHINPKSIRDKAYIILKQSGTCLHFVEIANKITAAGFDKKVVTTQAVHNELIRDPQFVLVGRGLYALKEWGYKQGTVAEIIEDLLRKKSPLTKQEIIAGVLKQRHVKKGTISLNLQKNQQFVRVGRAVYQLAEEKMKATQVA